MFGINRESVFDINISYEILIGGIYQVTGIGSGSWLVESLYANWLWRGFWLYKDVECITMTFSGCFSLFIGIDSCQSAVLVSFLIRRERYVLRLLKCNFANVVGKGFCGSSSFAVTDIRFTIKYPVTYNEQIWIYHWRYFALQWKSPQEKLVFHFNRFTELNYLRGFHLSPHRTSRWTGKIAVEGENTVPDWIFSRFICSRLRCLQCTNIHRFFFWWTMQMKCVKISVSSILHMNEI